MSLRKFCVGYLAVSVVVGIAAKKKYTAVSKSLTTDVKDNETLVHVLHDKDTSYALLTAAVWPLLTYKVFSDKVGHYNKPMALKINNRYYYKMRGPHRIEEFDFGAWSLIVLGHDLLDSDYVLDEVEM
jgi:hypothetical protein